VDVAGTPIAERNRAGDPQRGTATVGRGRRAQDCHQFLFDAHSRREQIGSLPIENRNGRATMSEDSTQNTNVVAILRANEADPSEIISAEDVFARAAKRRRDPDEGLVRVTKRTPSLISVRTPASTWYVRAARDPELSHVHDLLHAKELDDNHYFIDNDDLIDEIRAINPRVIRPLLLHLAVTKQGTAFLWKCGLPTRPTQ
jgi:hypothetical protein